MALRKIGTAKAHLPASGNSKSRYLNVGALFKDDDNARYVIKLDSVPVGSGWLGWINVFEDADPALLQDTALPKPKQGWTTPDYGDDDIPF